MVNESSVFGAIGFWCIEGRFVRRTVKKSSSIRALSHPTTTPDAHFVLHASDNPSAAMHQQLILIDARGHLLGRLASILAKELLNGQKIVVVRCEEINISGSLFRNKLKYFAFLRKRTATNPTRGHWHFRAPSRILFKTIRGMIPHKTERGAAALERLKVRPESTCNTH